MVQFLRDKQVEGFSVEAMNKAAGAGSLRIVRFLYENRDENCDYDAVSGAAMGGYLPIIKTLRDSHLICQWSFDFDAPELCRTVDSAAVNGHLRVVEYLIEQCYETCSFEAVEATLRHGHVRVAEYLFRECDDLPGDLFLTGACSYGHANSVKWLLKYHDTEEYDVTKALRSVLSDWRLQTNDGKDCLRQLMGDQPI